MSDSFRSRLSPNGLTCANAVCAHIKARVSTTRTARVVFTFLWSFASVSKISLARLQQLAELRLVIVDQHCRNMPVLDHGDHAGMRSDEAVVGLLNAGGPNRSLIVPPDQL